MPYVGDALRFPFFAFAADGTPATGLTLGDFTVVVDDPSGTPIAGVTVTDNLGNGQYVASKAATTFASVGEYLCVVTYGGATALAQDTIPIFASSVDSLWITTIANIWTFLQTLVASIVTALTSAGIPVVLQPLFNPENLEVTVPFGADLTIASALGRLELPSTVTALNLSTAGGTIRFSVRLKQELAGSTPVFNVTGTAVDATTGGFELTDPTHTRKLQPGTYFWSMTHETAGGLITPLNSGRYVVQDVATYN